MKIRIKLIKGEILVVEAEASDTIGQLKDIICLSWIEYASQASNMRLIYNGKILQDNSASIGMYELKDTDCLVCMVVKKAAAATANTTVVNNVVVGGGGGGGGGDVGGESREASREELLKHSADEIAALQSFFKDKCDIRKTDASSLSEALVLDYDLYSIRRLQLARADGSLVGILDRIGVGNKVALAVIGELSNLAAEGTTTTTTTTTATTTAAAAAAANDDHKRKILIHAAREKAAATSLKINAIASSGVDIESVEHFVMHPKDVGDLLLALSNGSIKDINVRYPRWFDYTCLIHQSHWGSSRIDMVFFLLTHDPPADPDVLSSPRRFGLGLGLRNHRHFDLGLWVGVRLGLG